MRCPYFGGLLFTGFTVITFSEGGPFQNKIGEK
jgi:hypothetical protein